MEHTTITRRKFIKVSAAAGTALSLGSLAGTLESTGLVPTVHAAEKGTKIIQTCCNGCTADCGVLAHVKNGRVIKLEGDPEFLRSDGALCVKGLTGIQALYNPNRLKYPMERVGARGENKWRRISWDQAIDKIARKLMEVREKYGAEAVFASTGGGGNPNFMGPGQFCNSFGTPNWFEPGAAQCYLPRMAIYDLSYGGNGQMLGRDTSMGDNQYLEAYFYKDPKMKSVVVWGAGPSYSQPSASGRVMVELRARGVKTVVIDPRFTPDASKADVWLPIRPGTDVALGLTWVRYILKHKLYDHEFVMKWTNLPYLVNTKTKMMLREADIKKGGSKDTFVVWDQKTKSAKALEFPWNDKLSPALEGAFKVNGVECKTGYQLLKERVEPWTLKKGGETCWLQPDKIEEAIKIYVQNTPGAVCHGVATDQYPNSSQAAHCTAMLNLLLGNVEKPGAALQRYDLEGKSPIDAFSTGIRQLLPEKQLKKRLGGREYKGMLMWWTGKVSTHLDAMRTGKPYKLKVWLERSGNKLGTVANTTEWIKAMQNLDLIVHSYMYPTSFSAYADILLPMSEWLEWFMPVNNMNTAFSRKETTHLFESVIDAWYWAQLAKRCAELGHEGCKRAFDPKETFPEPPYQDTIEKLADNMVRHLGMTWKEFEKKTPYDMVPLERWRQYYQYKKNDPKTGKPRGFKTPTRKCEIYLESLIHLGRTGKPFSPYVLPPASKDYDPLPYFMEPDENPNSKVGKEFPLVMTNGRLPMFHHLTLRNTPYTRELYPVAEIWINPVDAKKYGVSQSDWVWVESKRGKINAKALLTEGIPKGVVYMERFWNPETLDTKTHGCREMNVNVLSKESPPYNEVFGTYTLRGYQVKVYKASGPPKGVWQKPKEFEPWLPQPSDPTKRVKL